jgi:hypothetical protein
MPWYKHKGIVPKMVKRAGKYRVFAGSLFFVYGKNIIEIDKVGR